MYARISHLSSDTDRIYKKLLEEKILIIKTERPFDGQDTIIFAKDIDQIMDILLKLNNSCYYPVYLVKTSKHRIFV